MRRGLLVLTLLLGGPGGASEAPGWWQAFLAAPRMEARFTQDSDSAVFGKLTRKGLLRLAKGGRIRVEYEKGLLLVADGKTLVQYDPAARTAQRVDLRNASKEAPLLLVLLDPAALEQVFTVRAGAERDTFTLEPRKPGLPKVTLAGQGGLPRRISWTDPTGANQVLAFTDPHLPSGAFDASLFTFKAPAGTRWLSRP